MSTTTKPVNQKAWFLILPMLLCVAFSAILPLMVVVNYSVQDIISPERRVFVGTEWFAAIMRDDVYELRRAVCGRQSMEEQDRAQALAQQEAAEESVEPAPAPAATNVHDSEMFPRKR